MMWYSDDRMITVLLKSEVPEKIPRKSKTKHTSPNPNADYRWRSNLNLNTDDDGEVIKIL